MLLIKMCKRVLFTLAKSLACRPFRMRGVRCSVFLELFLSVWQPATFSHACIQSIKYWGHMIGTHLVLYFHEESVHQKCRFRSVWLCLLLNLSIRQGRLPVLWDWTGLDMFSLSCSGSVDLVVAHFRFCCIERTQTKSSSWAVNARRGLSVCRLIGAELPVNFVICVVQIILLYFELRILPISKHYLPSQNTCTLSGLWMPIWQELLLLLLLLLCKRQVYTVSGVQKLWRRQWIHFAGLKPLNNTRCVVSLTCCGTRAELEFHFSSLSVTTLVSLVRHSPGNPQRMERFLFLPVAGGGYWKCESLFGSQTVCIICTQTAKT